MPVSECDLATIQVALSWYLSLRYDHSCPNSVSPYEYEYYRLFSLLSRPEYQTKPEEQVVEIGCP
eukprot:scaffold459713_cov31-Prasinocladus_malaysianus.AAC.1